MLPVMGPAAEDLVAEDLAALEKALMLTKQHM
jgi:hypothetical protein